MTGPFTVTVPVVPVNQTTRVVVLSAIRNGQPWTGTVILKDGETSQDIIDRLERGDV